MTLDPTEQRTKRRVAIIGAGPSGLFTAERLLRQAADVEVDIFDRLPVPFGLVRYGVAADHQVTKGVARVLARTLSRPGARFFGNVEIGAAVGLDQLRAAYDAVVIAVGAGKSRALDLPGAQLSNVIDSWTLTSWLNARPDQPPLAVDWPRIRRVAVIGLGNVAIDVARLLLSTGHGRPHDLPAHVVSALRSASIDRVTIVGRGDADQARFGDAELRELVHLPGIGVSRSPVQSSAPAAIDALLDEASSTGSKHLQFCFGMLPLAFEGDTAVTAINVRDHRGDHSLPADLVFTCTGFETLPFAQLEQTAGRFAHDQYRIGDGLYVVGWAATGPRGTIADSRAIAHAVADRVQHETQCAGHRPFLPSGATDLAGWDKIDEYERAGATGDCVRVKIATKAAMLAVAAGHREGTVS